MATKDHSCLKSDTQHFGSSNQNGLQYNNLNLNGNQKGSSILETFQSNKNISTSSNSKKNDYETAATITKTVLDQDGFGKNQNQFSSWKKTEGGRNSFSNGSSATEETSNKWKSNKKSSSSNNSTLSIHITAYENSIEAQNGLNSSAAKNDGTNLSKIKINKVLKVLKTGFASMDAFEIPRQQTTESTNDPEIMGFKASQKLFNPNQPPPASSLDTTAFSVFGQQKLKILVKVFIDKIQVNVVKADFEDSIPILDMLPFIFKNAQLSSEDYEIQSITVMDKKTNENMEVKNDYVLQPFDKFQLFLAKKAQQHDIEILLQPDGQEEQQQLSIDTSKIQHIKDLSDALSSKLDIKDGEIKIQKFDEDFGESITVNGEEKFDPSKIYNIHVTKVVNYGVRIGPKVSGENVEEEKPAEASNEVKAAEALKPSIIAPTPLSTTVIQEECPSLSPPANEDVKKFEVPNMPDPGLPNVQELPAKVVPEDFGSSNRHNLNEAINKFNHNLSAILSTDENNSSDKPVDSNDEAVISSTDKFSTDNDDDKTDNELLGSDVNPSSDEVPKDKLGSQLNYFVDQAIREANAKISETANNATASDATSDQEPLPLQQSPSKSATETKIEKVKADVGKLLEKLTASICDKTAAKIMQICDFKDSVSLSSLVEFIFEKAVNEKDRAEIYANFCLAIHKTERNIDGASFQYLFRNEIIRKCRSSFEDTSLSECPAQIKKALEDLKEEYKKSKAIKDEKKIQNLKMAVFVYQRSEVADKDKEKQQMIGTIRFTLNLFKVGVLHSRIIEHSIGSLIRGAEQNGSEIMLESAVTFLKEIGPFFVQKNETTTELDAFIRRINQIKGFFNNQIESMIDELNCSRAQWNLDKNASIVNAASKNELTAPSTDAPIQRQQQRQQSPPQILPSKSAAEAKIEKVKADVEKLLEKLTSSNFNETATEIMQICDSDSQSAIVKLIFENAVHEQEHVELYANLCLALHKKEKIAVGEKSKRHFRGGIIRRCQKSFENTDLTKQRMLNTIKFVYHLFRIGFFDYSIIEKCLIIFLRNFEQNGKELMLELAMILMKEVGPFVDQKTEYYANFNGYIVYLETYKGAVSNQIESMIDELMELRDRNWAEKVVNKTIASKNESTVSPTDAPIQQQQQQQKNSSQIAPSKSVIDVKIEKLKSDVGNLLDKLFSFNCNEVSTEIMQICDWKDPTSCATIFDAIFDRAFDNPDQYQNYANLFLMLHKAISASEDDIVKNVYLAGLLEKIIKIFGLELSEFHQSMADKQNEIKKMENGGRRFVGVTLKKEIEEMNDTQKRKMCATSKLIAHLYQHELLFIPMIKDCLDILLQDAENKSDQMVEFAVDLLKEIEPFVAEKENDATQLDSCYFKLVEIKTKASPHIQGMIDKLKWISDQKSNFLTPKKHFEPPNGVATDVFNESQISEPNHSMQHSTPIHGRFKPPLFQWSDRDGGGGDDATTNPSGTNLNFEENLSSIPTGTSRFVPPHPPVSSNFDRTSRFSTSSREGRGESGGSGIPRGGMQAFTATINGRGGGSFSSRGGGYTPSAIPPFIGRGGGYKPSSIPPLIGRGGAGHTSTRGSSGFRAHNSPPRYQPRGANDGRQGSDARRNTMFDFFDENPPVEVLKRDVMHHGTVSSPPPWASKPAEEKETRSPHQQSSVTRATPTFGNGASQGGAIENNRQEVKTRRFYPDVVHQQSSVIPAAPTTGNGASQGGPVEDNHEKVLPKRRFTRPLESEEEVQNVSAQSKRVPAAAPSAPTPSEQPVKEVQNVSFAQQPKPATPPAPVRSSTPESDSSNESTSTIATRGSDSPRSFSPSSDTAASPPAALSNKQATVSSSHRPSSEAIIGASTARPSSGSNNLVSAISSRKTSEANSVRQSLFLPKLSTSNHKNDSSFCVPKNDAKIPLSNTVKSYESTPKQSSSVAPPSSSSAQATPAAKATERLLSLEASLKFKSDFEVLLQSYMNGTDEVTIVQSLVQLCADNPTKSIENIFAYGCENLKNGEEKSRKAALFLFVKCLNKCPDMKNAFPMAFERYCKNVVRNNIQNTIDFFSLSFSEFCGRILADESKSFNAKDFVAGMKSLPNMVALTLKEFGRTCSPFGQASVGEAIGKLYCDFVHYDSFYKTPQFHQVLQQTNFKYSKYNNMKALLMAYAPQFF